MSEIMKLDANERPSEDVLEKLGGILLDGGVLVYPTTTLYGLAASMQSKKGIKAVYDIKRLPMGNPISIMVHRPQLTQYCDIPVLAFPYLRTPVPLSVLLPAKPNVPAELTENGLVSIRLPDNFLTLELTKRIGPITATSANRHGGSNPSTVKTAMNELGDDVEIYIDSGPTKYKGPTTIIDLSTHEINIIRQGVYTKEEVMGFYGR